MNSQMVSVLKEERTPVLGVGMIIETGKDPVPESQPSELETREGWTSC